MAVVLLLAFGCAGLPRGLSPAHRSPSEAGIPGGQTSRGQTSAAYLSAEEWTGFSQTVLWPQEWALRSWHRFEVAGASVNLTPAATIPPVPEVQVSGLGGDPGLWRLEWTEPVPREAASGRLSVIVLTASEAGGIPAGVAAVRKAALASGKARGLIRVVGETLEGDRIRVSVELR